MHTWTISSGATCRCRLMLALKRWPAAMQMPLALTSANDHTADFLFFAVLMDP